MASTQCRPILLAVVLAALALSCLDFDIGPLSLAPWFEQDARTFDRALLGRWWMEGEDNWLRFRKTSETTYSVTTQEPPEGSEGARIVGTLADIKGRRYLDVWMISEKEQLALHQLFGVEIEGNTLRLRRLMPSDELREELEWDESGALVLSESSSLHSFLEQHGASAEAWADDPLVFTRRRRS